MTSEAAIEAHQDTVRVPLQRRGGEIAEAVRRLDEAGVGIADIAVRRPTLDDVFIGLTGFTITTDAMRALFVDAPAGNNVWGAGLWSLGLIAVFAPLAVRRYRRTVST